MIMHERLNIFFGKVKKELSERLSELKPEDIAKFAAKEAVGSIPVVGRIIKAAFEEFSPDEKEELIKGMKELSEVQFKEISENIGVSIEYLEGIRKFTLYTFEELSADHKEIKNLLFRLIETVEPSTSMIQVGRDFNIGDTSGQIAFGKDITQYKGCTFSLPDGSTVHGKSWLYAEGIRPTTDPANIFGRRQELEKIDEFLKDSSALAITGCRSTGKSTLASMYLDRIEKIGKFAGIYWRKVDETIDISDVVGSFFMLIGKPIKDVGRYKGEDLLNLLFRELTVAPYFLVLDNFEILLDPNTNKPIKPGFSDVVEMGNKRGGISRIIFTSWECPASKNGIRPNCYNIGGLDDPAAIQLLRQQGLTEPEDELKSAIKLSGGHPLALILLVQLVKGDGETLSSILADDTLWMGEGGEVATNILDKVYKERLNEDERKLLQYVSLYRVPVPLEAIVISADDPNWTGAKVERTALSLKRKSLLQKTGENYRGESLIAIYAYNKLADRVERHKLACQYYLDLPLPENRAKKEEVQSLIEAHHHACMAEEYDRAVGIIYDYNLHKDLDRWGNCRTLIELYAGVLPKDHFRGEPLLDSLATHSGVLGNLGIAYRNLGQVEKAIEYHESALAISRGIEDRRGEEANLGGLGNAYSVLGQVEKAIKYYEDALVILKGIGDGCSGWKWLGNLGNAYSDLGQVAKAIEHYGDSLVIARKIEDRRGEGANLGNLGNAYRALGQVEKAIEYYEDVLVISKETGDRRVEGNTIGSLGLAYRDLGQVEKAIEHYGDSLVIARKIEDRRGEGANLSNLGNAYSDLGQVEKAIKYYEDALVILKEIGDGRSEGALLGNLGNTYRDLGQVKKAIEYHESALVIARRLGNRRGEGADLGNLGNAYRALGQVEKAIEYYEGALAIAKSIVDRRNEGAWLENLGNVYIDLGQVAKAIECYEDSLVIARKIGDRRGEGNRLGNLGNAYGALGQIEKAIEYYEDALVIAREIGDRRSEGVWLGSLGTVYCARGQVEKAIEYHEDALVISKEIGDQRGEGAELGNLGNAHLALEQVEKAIEYYEGALVIARELVDRRGEGAVLGNLGLAYSGLGQVEKAIEYFEDALAIGEEIKDPRIIDFCEQNLQSLKNSGD